MNTRSLIARALALVGLLSLFLLPSCASAPAAAAGDTALVQKALDALLPPTFIGHVRGVHRNQYFELELEGDGLARTEHGWTWTWLTYRRQSHFPLFAGLTWASSGEVTLGNKP